MGYIYRDYLFLDYQRHRQISSLRVTTKLCWSIWKYPAAIKFLDFTWLEGVIPGSLLHFAHNKGMPQVPLHLAAVAPENIEFVACEIIGRYMKGTAVGLCGAVV